VNMRALVRLSEGHGYWLPSCSATTALNFGLLSVHILLYEYCLLSEINSYFKNKKFDVTLDQVSDQIKV
jgi:hypothetical protein